MYTQQTLQVGIRGHGRDLCFASHALSLPCHPSAQISNAHGFTKARPRTEANWVSSPNIYTGRPQRS